MSHKVPVGFLEKASVLLRLLEGMNFLSDDDATGHFLSLIFSSTSGPTDAVESWLPASDPDRSKLQIFLDFGVNVCVIYRRTLPFLKNVNENQ